MKVNIISLGCAKNLVDNEILAGMLKRKNFEFVDDARDADVVILSTCGFIGAARKEAKSYINRLSKLKQEKNFMLIVIGCLPQLEKENLIKQYPQIDVIFGISDYYKIPEILKNKNDTYSQRQNGNRRLSVGYLRSRIEISSPESFISTHTIPRVLSTPKSYAYLKIADGCDNRCAYCLIPTIRGFYRERPIEDILKEAEQLVSVGVKELIIISHDTTFYGMKLYKQPVLHKLVAKLSKIKNLYWIRILYSHPAHFYDALIEEISSNEKVCKYVDIPIQHTSDKILSLMNRRTSRKNIYDLVEKLRKVKNITLRTTVMVGFPGETEQDFELMMNDLRQLEFDWLGCYMFSKQKNTLAEKMGNHVDKQIKKQRLDMVMRQQQEITYKKNRSYIGKNFPVLVDSIKFGHTEFQCPEVDGRTYFLTQPKNVVEKIKIESVINIYDLAGKFL